MQDKKLMITIILGIAIIAMAVPIAYAMNHTSEPQNHYNQQAQQAWHGHGRGNGGPEYMYEHQCTNCNANCNCHQASQARECCGAPQCHGPAANATRAQQHMQAGVEVESVSGVVENIDSNGYMTITTQNGDVNVVFRGIWSVNGETIPYYKLAEEIQQGESISVTGYYMNCSDMLRATEITIENTTYTLAVGPHS